jgi:hypothetical protein
MKEIIVIVTCLCGMPKKDTRTLAQVNYELIQLERRIAWKDSVINEYNKKNNYKIGLIYLELSK